MLAASDPAQPFGASLSWPESSGRPSRRAGALVVLDDGEPVVYIERGGKSLITFAAADRSDGWANALAEVIQTGRTRLEITTIDGQPARQSSTIAALEEAGFVRGYRGWSWR